MFAFLRGSSALAAPLAAPVAAPAGGAASGGEQPARPKIGLALGSGVARGWCHIGILRAFDAIGLKPDVIVGSSIGAVVGGCYAAGRLDDIEAFARSLTRRRMASLLDITFAGGLLGGQKLLQTLEAGLEGRRIENLPCAFAAVATELATGNEVWLRQGPLAQACSASYAIPGLFEPVKIGGRLLVDGALVNPIPVSAARALGADIVIALGLVGDSMYRGTILQNPDATRAEEEALEDLAENAAQGESWMSRIGSPRAFFLRHLRRGRDGGPGIASVMTDAFTIIHDRIARSRLAGDPPDILINARLNDFRLFDFHRADELIALGEETARRWTPELTALARRAAPAGQA